MPSSEDSLSVVLPVYNDAASLSRRVAELLEIVPDLTDDFEILILNNGSTDSTEEVAVELVRQYPQLRAVNQPRQRDAQQNQRISIEQTAGDLVMIFDENARILPTRIREMWELRFDRRVVVARNSEPGPATLVNRLKDWASQLPLEDHAPTGLQMVRRPRERQRVPAPALANASLLDSTSPMQSS